MNAAHKPAPQLRDPAPISNRKSRQRTRHVTPTKQTKAPQISNRESLRLEIDVTPKKQRPDHRSNREKVPLFAALSISLDPVTNSNRKLLRPVRHVTSTKQKAAQISNREPLRLEIDVTPTKQRPDQRSNREKMPLFAALSTPLDPTPDSNRKSLRPARRVTTTKQTEAGEISNREALRLEIDVTSTKQRPDLRSNREKTPLFALSGLR
jgi:hypothetical protein